MYKVAAISSQNNWSMRWSWSVTIVWSFLTIWKSWKLWYSGYLKLWWFDLSSKVILETWSSCGFSCYNPRPNLIILEKLFPGTNYLIMNYTLSSPSILQISIHCSCFASFIRGCCYQAGWWLKSFNFLIKSIAWFMAPANYMGSFHKAMQVTYYSHPLSMHNDSSSFNTRPFGKLSTIVTHGVPWYPLASQQSTLVPQKNNKLWFCFQILWIHQTKSRYLSSSLH
jgi:hypothetical protein